MRPLHAIGLGLALIALRAGTPDLLPDPVGWLLVLLGVRRLPAALPRRPLLTGLAVLALLVSLPLWVPTLADRILEADPSLQWALNLPQLGFVLVLGAVLGPRAAAAGDRGARTSWSLVVAGTAVAAVLPVIVFGGGVSSLETASLVLAGAVLLTAVVLCLVHAGRSWADPAPHDAGTGADRPGGG